MKSVEHTQSRAPRRLENLQHVRHTAIRFGHRPKAIPDLSSLGDEVVVGVDYNQCCGLPVVRQVAHRILCLSGLARVGVPVDERRRRIVGTVVNALMIG